MAENTVNPAAEEELSGEKLNKRIIRSKVSSLSVTCRRKTVTFSDDININRFCDASGSIRLLELYFDSAKKEKEE